MTEPDAGRAGDATTTSPVTATPSYDVEPLRPRPSTTSSSRQPARRPGAASTRVALEDLDELAPRPARAARRQGDASTGDRVPKYAQRNGKLVVTLEDRRSRRAAVHGLASRYGGTPAARARATLGTAGLGGARRRRASWPASRTVRRPGSPATTGPTTRRRYRIAVTAPPDYHVVANGALRRAAAAAASATTWVYEQTEPMATYLATVQIGRYDERRCSVDAGADAASVAPPRRSTSAGRRAVRPTAPR